MQRTSSAVYGFAAIDDSGRLCPSRPLLETLGWRVGTRLAVTQKDCLLVIARDADGVMVVGGLWTLRLPAAARLFCVLTAGSSMLLAADPTEAQLVVYPPAALDLMTAWLHTSTFARGAS
jgi:hypothetical protein